MRIRKNAKLSPLLFSSSSSSQGGGGGGSVPVEAFQTNVCQLNQSPWDVIPFDFDSIKFEVDDRFRFNNGSAGDSFGTVENESVASMMNTIDDVAMMVLDDNHDNLHGKKVAVDNNGYKGLGKKKKSCCNAMDSKGLLCKNGVKQGHLLSLIRSQSQSHNNNGNNSTVKKTQPVVVAGSRRGRPRAATKKGSSSSSNPNEFYYYSGFGPLWGKRRGDKNGESSKNIISIGGDSTMLESNNVNVNANVNVLGGVDNVNRSLKIDNIGVFDFVDDEDDEEDCNNDDDDNGKKRMRKPVKERSLKSLM